MEAFETERLLLRPLGREDLEHLYALYRDPQVMRYVTGEPRDRDATAEALERHLEDHRLHRFGLCAAIEKVSGKMIGRCGLIPWRRKGPWPAEIAWLFARPYWGRGLATEFGTAMLEQAFGPLRLARVLARAMPDNRASIAVMKKLGMQPIGGPAEEVWLEAARDWREDPPTH